MDTTYWGRNFGVVIMKDSLSGGVLWYKFIDRHERLEDYWEGITYLNSLGHTILAIVADGLNPMETGWGGGIRTGSRRNAATPYSHL